MNAPEGTYLAQPREVETFTTRSGKKQLRIDIMVTHQLLPDASGQANWSNIQPIDTKMYLPLADNAWDYTMSKLMSVGFTGFSNPGFREKVLIVECRHREWQGEIRVGWDIPLPKFNKALSEREILELDARWEASTKSVPVPGGEPSIPPASLPQPTAPEPSYVDPPKDDVPF